MPPTPEQIQEQWAQVCADTSCGHPFGDHWQTFRPTQKGCAVGGGGGYGCSCEGFAIRYTFPIDQHTEILPITLRHQDLYP